MLKYTTKVMIVDDHPIVRCGIARLIGQEADMEVCGEFDGTEDIPAIAEGLRPDVLILDISLKNTDGIAILRALRRTNSSLPVLILSMHDNKIFIARAIKAGANGYVIKDQSADQLITAIRDIRQGRLFLCGNSTEEILRTLTVRNHNDKKAAIDLLSDRERQIFIRIGKGYSTQEIADQLEIKFKTVETYRGRIKDKLNLPSPHNLAAAAIEWATKENITSSAVF